MRSLRWRHVLVVAGLAGVVSAQPSPPNSPKTKEAGFTPADEDNGVPPKQATAQPDAATPAAKAPIPDWTPGPARIAVTPFENHVSNGKSLEWVVAEAPFEIAEKAENVLSLEAALPPLYVPGERVPPEADSVAEFAKKTGAAYVVTGWFDRLGDNLRMAVLVWKAGGLDAKIVGNAQRQGPQGQYHKVLGEAMAEAFTEAGITVDTAQAERLTRTLSNDIYPVFMMGRGLGYFSGALAAMDVVFGMNAGSGSAGAQGPDLKTAEHDLERAVFLDPKLFEAQRLLGELYMATANGDPKLVAKATGKFNYAADLAPDDVPSLRAAAFALAHAGKNDAALELFKKLVARHPWDLDARYQLGAALWQAGEAQAAEHQLEQVTARLPDHLQARRVLVLIHSSRNDTQRLIRELEAIETRVPQDLEIKADLASAYGAVGKWDKAIKELETIAVQRPDDLALLVRIGDAHRKHASLDTALGWYQKAARIAPDSSLPGFMAAQALADAGRIPDATRAYTLLQKFEKDKAYAEQALGVLALRAGHPDDAAWYLRLAAHNLPRVLEARRAVITAELARKDAAAALLQVEPALAAWPDDPMLHYLGGVAYALSGDEGVAREHLATALKLQSNLPAATAALATINGGGTPAVDYKPEIARPWGDGEALQAMLDQFEQSAAAMKATRKSYQDDVLTILGALGQGPKAPGQARVKTCPVGRLAPTWNVAQDQLSKYARMGVELESAYRFIQRHEEAGMTASLLPNSRIAVATAKKTFRTALADVGELRAEWVRGIGPELRAAGCTDKLLQAALKDPARYRVIVEDKPEPLPQKQPPRAKPRTTFFVDNTRCPDPVDVWIDGTHIGQVSPGRRSALVTDGGERTLCLLTPGGAQCGDRGTLREVYLHDGWSTTMYCPK